MTGLIPIWVAQRIYDEFYKQHGGENDSGIQVGFIVPENYTKWAYLDNHIKGTSQSQIVLRFVKG
jgi:hypothetical protein